jgi:hypothetical protein
MGEGSADRALYHSPVMAMYQSRPIPTRNELHRTPDPVFEPGDRVQLLRAPGQMPGHQALDGARGTVVRVSGGRVVLELDEEYMASGLVQKIFNSYPGELRKIERVGKLGSDDLFADDQEDVEEE